MPPPTPSTAPARMAVGALSQSTRLFFDPKSILFFHRFVMPFLTHFDPDLGAFLDPFWHPNRAKFRQNAVPSLIFFKNENFHEKL